ncbi:helix-turn-helix domain-containing protein [Niabella sp. W65]|nr:helix-turn-helix domain-containing protein [Niabella sp. W65]MCH7368325.1 helix-turn-helix domain-containing protein [Niabella sp. W65]ULT43923.1 helix-turn-helix domain-containing protein [Niabella sp. I65]
MSIRNPKYDLALGENLRKVRTAKKLSRETLGAMAGVEPKQIYLIEVKGQSPTVATLVALALAMKLHPKKLLDFEFEFEE